MLGEEVLEYSFFKGVLITGGCKEVCERFRRSVRRKGEGGGNEGMK